MTAGTEAWRVAGMTYLRYVNIASHALRQAVKAEVKAKIKNRTDFSMRVASVDNGKIKDRREVTVADKL
jgi:F-type H+-transporting ATPase subunit epsilon